MTWTNEQFSAEYELIQKKQSKLPYSQRKLIVELTEKKETTNEVQ